MWSAGAAGFCFAFGFLSRQSNALDCVAVVALYLVLVARAGIRRDGVQLRSLTLSFGVVGVSFLATVGLIAAAFFRAGAFKDALFCFWTYNVEYYTGTVTAVDRVHVILRALENIGRPGGIGFLVLGGLGVVLVGVRRASGCTESSFTARTFVALWSVFALVGTSLSGRMFGHYFIQILVPWSLLGGLFIATLIELPSKVGSRWRRACLAFSGIILVGIFVGFQPYLAMLSPEKIERQGKWVVDQPTRNVAHYVRETTASDASIFVWGFYPQLYALSKRIPASRFGFCTPITGANAGGKAVPGAMSALMEDLISGRPELIIDTAPGGYFGWDKYPIGDFPPLADLIATSYDEDYQVHRQDGAAIFNVYRLKAP